MAGAAPDEAELMARVWRFFVNGRPVTAVTTERVTPEEIRHELVLKFGRGRVEGLVAQ